MVGIPLTKLQFGSEPLCSSPNSNVPPEKTRFGPSENRCFTAAVSTAVIGISSRQSTMVATLVTVFIAVPLMLKGGKPYMTDWQEFPLWGRAAKHRSRSH